MISYGNRITLYYILTIGITWSLWIPTLLISAQNHYFVPSVSSLNLIFNEGFKDRFHALLYILNQLGVYGPFISAVVILRYFTQVEDLADFSKQLIKWKADYKWYIFLFLIPISINLGSLGLAALAMADLTLAFFPGISLLLLILLFLNNIITSGFEEPGWRGFLLPELRKNYSAYKSSIIVGIMWALWHYPYVWYLNFIELKLGLFLTVISIIGFTALITFGSVIYSWIYFNTRSIFILIIFHALQNILPIIIIGGVIDPLGGFSTAILTILIVILITKIYGEKTLKGLTDEEKKKIKEKNP